MIPPPSSEQKHTATQRSRHDRYQQALAQDRTEDKLASEPADDELMALLALKALPPQYQLSDELFFAIPKHAHVKFVCNQLALIKRNLKGQIQQPLTADSSKALTASQKSGNFSIAHKEHNLSKLSKQYGNCSIHNVDTGIHFKSDTTSMVK